MGAHHLHPHHQEHGFLHRLPAGIKLSAALTLVLTVVLLPRELWTILVAVAMALIALVLASRISLMFLLKRMLLLEPLVLGVAGLMLFQPDGLARCVFAMGKANICLLSTLLLSCTTPASEMLQLLQRLRVPWLFVSTLTLMHRYLFVLADESERMRRARASRTLNREKRREWRALSSVIGHLFLRA